MIFIMVFIPLDHFLQVQDFFMHSPSFDSFNSPAESVQSSRAGALSVQSLRAGGLSVQSSTADALTFPLEFLYFRYSFVQMVYF